MWSHARDSFHRTVSQVSLSSLPFVGAVKISDQVLKHHKQYCVYDIILA
jgi:hypothetical protein